MQTVLTLIASIAIYEKLGVIEAMKYLNAHGYTHPEAVEIIALYDTYCEAARSGNVHKLYNAEPE